MGDFIPGTSRAVDPNGHFQTVTSLSETRLPSSWRLAVFALLFGTASVVILRRLPEFSVVGVLLAFITVSLVMLLLADAKLLPFYDTFQTIRTDARAVALAFLGFCILTGCCVLAAAMVGGIGSGRTAGEVDEPSPYLAPDSTLSYQSSPGVLGDDRARVEPWRVDRSMASKTGHSAGISVVRCVRLLLPRFGAGDRALGAIGARTRVHHDGVVHGERRHDGTRRTPSGRPGDMDTHWRRTHWTGPVLVG